MAAKGQGRGKGQGPDREDQIDEQELEQLYAWVDSLPLSIRTKKKLDRDFSDGVYIAEIIQHYFPSLVDMHNYSNCSNAVKKLDNWRQLNGKVFSKMNFTLDDKLIEDLINQKIGVMEKFLLMLQVKIRRAEYARDRFNDKPEADQHQMSSRKGKIGVEDTKGSQFSKHKQELKAMLLIEEVPAKTKNVHFAPLERLEPSVKGGQYKQEVPKRQHPHMIESDMVSRYLVEDKEQEVQARDETIQMLQEKVKKMEKLLHLKDVQLAEYTRSMEVTKKPLAQQVAQQQHPAPQLNLHPNVRYQHKPLQPADQHRHTNVPPQAQTRHPIPQQYNRQSEVGRQNRNPDIGPKGSSHHAVPYNSVQQRDHYRSTGHLASEQYRR